MMLQLFLTTLAFSPAANALVREDDVVNWLSLG